MLKINGVALSDKQITVLREGLEEAIKSVGIDIDTIKRNLEEPEIRSKYIDIINKTFDIDIENQETNTVIEIDKEFWYY